MKLKYIILIILLILNITYCNSIQPKPDGYGWDRCAKCEGYGYIIKSSNADRDQIKDFEDRNDNYNAIELFHNDPKYLEKAESDAQNYNNGYSGRKRNKITCSMCNGKGWIKH